jgi:hypothetical protein
MRCGTTFSTRPLLGQGIVPDYSKSVAATLSLQINPPGFGLSLQARFLRGMKWRNWARKGSDIKTGDRPQAGIRSHDGNDPLSNT